MLLLPMGPNAVGSITSIGAITAAFANFFLVPFVNERVKTVVAANLRVACALMAVGFFLFSVFNGGTSSDNQAVHNDNFYYSLAACTFFLSLGGAILAACCAATLSGEYASFFITLHADMRAGLVPPDQTGALLGLDMSIRFCFSM
jgi:hypothetical protein